MDCYCSSAQRPCRFKSPEKISKSDETPVKQAYYDPTDEDDLTAVIIFAFADLENISPKDIGPPVLYHSVDVTTIEEILFASELSDSSCETTQSVCFDHLGYYITVRESGQISFYEMQ